MSERPKILIADDDVDNRTIAQDALERAGYDILLASDGEEALKIISSEKPAAVLLDLSMPKLTGWEVATRIKSDPSLVHIPLIAFTAHALVGQEIKAKSAGCDDYIAKPCQPKVVVERIAHWVRQAESQDRDSLNT